MGHTTGYLLLRHHSEIQELSVRKPPGIVGSAPHESLGIPLLLALSAPVTVMFTIGSLRSIWWTFAIYQIGICLLAPAIESRLKGRSWRKHAIMLGLLIPTTADGSDAGRGSRRLVVTAILGVATALVTGVFLVVTRDRFLDPDRLQKTVETWGVSPGQLLPMLSVMAVLDAAAEELFWRGYFPGRVALSLPRSPLPIGLTVVLPAFLYASYHVATIGHLVGRASGVMVMTGGVLGAGLLWGWLRRRTGSVWPPLGSHGGAVLAYLAVHYWLTGRGGN